MTKGSRPASSQPSRRDRLIREEVHDTYKMKEKPGEPAACPQCGAVFHGGRWTWEARPADADEETCPACYRIRDNYPAGFVSLEGPYLKGHRKEILNLVQNAESREKQQHPLKRIMTVEELEDRVVVTTTDIHLARSIGEAVHRACKGSLDYHYVKEEDLLRVRWQR